MTRRSVTTGILIAAAVVVVGWVGYRAIASRRVAQETDRLAVLLRVAPDCRVADVGAGSGAFTEQFASRVVPSGHVFATEIDAAAVDALRARVERAQLTNVTVIQARAE